MSTTSFKLEKLTVVILSRERQHCLQKVIPFWEKHGIRTLIVDQSLNQLDRQTLDGLEFVSYFHLDKPFRERCKKVVELLDSEYSIVISDDELYIPSALDKMLKTLENNSELISVGGMALSVWKYGPMVCGSWPYQPTNGYSNLEESSLSRIERHTNNGKKSVTTFLTSNLTRTEHIQDCLTVYSKSPIISTEAASIFAICSAGKFKYIDVLYWIRNWNELPRSNVGWDRSLMIHDWWPKRASLSPESYIGFENALRAVYSKYSSSESYEYPWNLILSASKSAYSDELPDFENRLWRQSRVASYLKFLVKTISKPSTHPQRYQEILSAMQSKGIEIDFSQSMKAISVVSKLYPYRNW